MAEYVIDKIDEMPPSIKGGNRKPSAQTLELQEKIASLDAHRIVGTFTENEINALTQRVRTAGERIGLKVKIHSVDGGFAFQETNAAKAAEKKAAKKSK